MKTIRRKTPTEESFLLWINGHPESFHSLDEQKFYQFAKCIFSYGARKWLDKSYFKSRILEIRPYFQLDNIDEFYNRLLILKKYKESYKLERVTNFLDGSGYVQRQVICNEIREVIITREEFENGGITTKEFKNRIKL